MFRLVFGKVNKTFKGGIIHGAKSNSENTNIALSFR